MSGNTVGSRLFAQCWNCYSRYIARRCHDRSAVDSNSNSIFLPIGETIGTVAAEKISEMLYGSPRCSPHHSLLCDADVESLIMEQQHRSLRFDRLSTSTLTHRWPLLGRQWSITNPAIGRQMNQSACCFYVEQSCEITIK